MCDACHMSTPSTNRYNGARHYLWRAVDQGGHVLDILVQIRRNKKVAKKFLRRLLKDLRYVPGLIIKDELRSYGAAKQQIFRSSRWGHQHE
jgi:putative transposase